MPTYHFQELKRTKLVKLKCACGKRFQRTLAATQTVNPFNKNADGTVKTAREIYQELAEEIAAMEPNKYQRKCPGCGEQAEIVPPKPAKVAP